LRILGGAHAPHAPSKSATGFYGNTVPDFLVEFSATLIFREILSMTNDIKIVTSYTNFRDVTIFISFVIDNISRNISVSENSTRKSGTVFP
jgi:hypothetical protein